MIDETFTGTFHEGNFIPSNPFKWYGITRLCEDETVVVTLQKYYGQRSSAQNKYFWGIVIKEFVESNLGYTADEVNDMIKLKFLIRPAEQGKPMTLRSTKDLDTAHFEELMTQIRDWAAQEFNLYIPAPNEDPNLPF